jgi:hypothetical protein
MAKVEAQSGEKVTKITSMVREKAVTLGASAMAAFEFETELEVDELVLLFGLIEGRPDTMTIRHIEFLARELDNTARRARQYAARLREVLS